MKNVSLPKSCANLAAIQVFEEKIESLPTVTREADPLKPEPWPVRKAYQLQIVPNWASVTLILYENLQADICIDSPLSGHQFQLPAGLPNLAASPLAVSVDTLRISGSAVISLRDDEDDASPYRRSHRLLSRYYDWFDKVMIREQNEETVKVSKLPRSRVDVVSAYFH